jgi:hypothetical protein
MNNEANAILSINRLTQAILSFHQTPQDYNLNEDVQINKFR